MLCSKAFASQIIDSLLVLLYQLNHIIYILQARVNVAAIAYRTISKDLQQSEYSTEPVIQV